MPAYDLSCKKCASAFSFVTTQLQERLSKGRAQGFQCPACGSRRLTLDAFDNLAMSSVGEVAARLFQAERRIEALEAKWNEENPPIVDETH